MIIVLGPVRVHPGKFDEVLAVSSENVLPLSSGPVWIAHAAHSDTEDEPRAGLVEKWTHRAAPNVRFQVPTSSQILKAARALCSAAPVIGICTAAILGSHRAPEHA